MANTTYNGSLVKLFLKNSIITNNEWLEAVCSTDLTLDQTSSEIDTSSKCGPGVLSGKKDATLSTTLQLLREAADTGTIGWREIRKAYEDDLTFDWIIGDAYTGATIENLSGNAIITSQSASWPNEDVASVDITLKVNGNVVDGL